MEDYAYMAFDYYYQKKFENERYLENAFYCYHQKKLENERHLKNTIDYYNHQKTLENERYLIKKDQMLGNRLRALFEATEYPNYGYYYQDVDDYFKEVDKQEDESKAKKGEEQQSEDGSKANTQGKKQQEDEDVGKATKQQAKVSKNYQDSYFGYNAEEEDQEGEDEYSYWYGGYYEGKGKRANKLSRKYVCKSRRRIKK